MSEHKTMDAELRQVITEALVSMVTGVTGLAPPTGPGAIPDFIQAPIDRAVEKISASLPVGVPDGSIYVECRQCDVCQHGGINDAAAGLAACHDCDWTGTDPVEDKCPGCQSENCMAAACPKCGSRYVLVASEDIAAPAAPAVKAEQAPVTQDLRAKLISGLDEIGALSRNLRQGGCDSSDLPGLEEGLTHAIDMAHELISMLEGPSLPAAGSAVPAFSVVCKVCNESSTLDERRDLSGCCWSCGHEIDLDPYLRAALSAQQAGAVSVPVELLQRICWPVVSGSDRHTHSEAVAELRALLSSSERGGEV
ncbi:hypothetical protein ACUTAF_07960 [Pseudomonas sp. SP16.1]|uniref:hypothetical protein n=1 Tax=Pseudomonas sp. SP16.1 TaxID=3458854 RepID=UPI004045F208